MGTEHEQQLFGLMGLAQDHQKAVQAALDGLAVERVELAKERVALAEAVAQVMGSAGHVQRAAEGAIPAIQTATGKAVETALGKSLEGPSKEAAKAIDEATQPVLEKLGDVLHSARQAEDRLRDAGNWFAWKWVAVAAGGMAGACLLAWASVAWERHQVEQLAGQKVALQEEVAQLQAQADELAKKGARIRMMQCGDENRSRLCIEAASNQGSAPGQAKWQAPWGNPKTGQQFVIPRGY